MESSEGLLAHDLKDEDYNPLNGEHSDDDSDWDDAYYNDDVDSLSDELGGYPDGIPEQNEGQ